MQQKYLHTTSFDITNIKPYPNALSEYKGTRTVSFNTPKNKWILASIRGNYYDFIYRRDIPQTALNRHIIVTIQKQDGRITHPSLISFMRKQSMPTPGSRPYFHPIVIPQDRYGVSPYMYAKTPSYYHESEYKPSEGYHEIIEESYREFIFYIMFLNSLDIPNDIKNEIKTRLITTKNIGDIIDAYSIAQITKLEYSKKTKYGYSLCGYSK